MRRLVTINKHYCPWCTSIFSREDTPEEDDIIPCKICGKPVWSGRKYCERVEIEEKDEQAT